MEYAKPSYRLIIVARPPLPDVDPIFFGGSGFFCCISWAGSDTAVSALSSTGPVCERSDFLRVGDTVSGTSAGSGMVIEIETLPVGCSIFSNFDMVPS